MSNPNQAAERTRLLSLIAGLQKHFSNASSLAFGGQTLSPQALIALLQSLIDAGDAAAAAKVSARDAVKAERAKALVVRPTVRAFVKFVYATFAEAQDLADFGLAPHKPQARLPLSTKVEAKAKSKATRQARHTMGSKQRREVKGSAAPAPAGGAQPGTSGPNGSK